MEVREDLPEVTGREGAGRAKKEKHSGGVALAEL